MRDAGTEGRDKVCMGGGVCVKEMHGQGLMKKPNGE